MMICVHFANTTPTVQNLSGILCTCVWRPCWYWSYPIRTWISSLPLDWSIISVARTAWTCPRVLVYYSVSVRTHSRQSILPNRRTSPSRLWRCLNFPVTVVRSSNNESSWPALEEVDRSAVQLVLLLSKVARDHRPNVDIPGTHFSTPITHTHLRRSRCCLAPQSPSGRWRSS